MAKKKALRCAECKSTNLYSEYRPHKEWIGDRAVKSTILEYTCVDCGNTWVAGEVTPNVEQAPEVVTIPQDMYPEPAAEAPEFLELLSPTSDNDAPEYERPGEDEV